MSYMLGFWLSLRTGNLPVAGREVKGGFQAAQPIRTPSLPTPALESSPLVAGLEQACLSWVV